VGAKNYINMSNKQLNLGVLLFFGLISLGLIVSNVSSGKYRTSITTVMDVSFDDDFLVGYAELYQLIQNPGNDIQFFDLRDPGSFASGHISGAINIPEKKIYSKEFRKALDQEGQKILYSHNEHEAVYAAMILLGKGYSNIRVVVGGFDTIEAYVLKDGLNPSYMYYKDDKARFDYPRFMDASGTGQNREADQNNRKNNMTIEGLL
jgi:rhodanese-related sulfurtransferase